MGKGMIDIVDKRTKGIVSIVIAVFIVIILGSVIVMNIQSTNAQRLLLEDSIKNQLTSITVAARDMLDADMIDGYNSQQDVNDDFNTFAETRQRLRDLAKETGADYIYVLKYIDDEVMFIMDTDEEDESIFISYEPAAVHLDAFAGQDSVDIMNVKDEYGSYNTAAVPIYADGKVIAVVSADIEDYYLKESNNQAMRSQIILICVMALVLAIVTIMIIFLLSRVANMQRQLSDMARRDVVTGLPNRQYLIEYLESKTKNTAPFALFFIDLDNFKKVNDTAGHDMGDELLRKIAAFLEAGYASSMAFRPAPGKLNIAARIGGDEFVQIIDGIENEGQAEQVASKLLRDFSSGEFSHFENSYGLGLSVGIALYPQHSNDFNILIKYADIAMYHAKRAGKNDYRVYREDMAPKNEK